MELTLLDTNDLAKRWGISPLTLRNWRHQGRGPKYIKLHAGRQAICRYRIADVLKYEASMVRENTRDGS